MIDGVIVNSKVDRKIDVFIYLVKMLILIILENIGKLLMKLFLYVLELLF